MIRKRLPAVELACESFVIGTKSQTKIALLHLKDVASPTVMQEARNRLQRLQQKQPDGILNSSQLEEALGDRKFSIFPLFSYSGRPDFVVSSLLNGRFVLLVDGSSTASLAPVTLFYLLEGSTDSNTVFFFAIFQRWIRLIGLALAMLLPAFWIALNGYQTDQIPYTLLATVVISRQGVPMSSPIEALMMILLFELFREAGIRLPSAIGQTLSVVGGLIIGQSAISAGLTSPTMLVMIATAAVASFILGNQDLSGTVRLINLLITLMASLFGMFGFFISVFAVVLYLVNLRSFGVPYMAPVAPVVLPDLLRFFLPLPWGVYRKRPEVLDPRDPVRQKEAAK